MKKMLVSDFDETFYINNEDMKKNINGVRKFRKCGNIFVIATGRSYNDFKNELKLYPIEYDYLVINQGATIIDKNDNVIKNYPIDNNTKNKLIQYLDLRNQDDMFACSELESRTKIENINITKIHKIFATLDKANQINQNVNKKFGEYVKSYLVPSINAIEIISSTTDKSISIKEISKIEKIRKEKIYTIGDSYNDIEMIKEFNGNCVKGAINEVKEMSNNIYESVYNLIEEIIGE